MEKNKLTITLSFDDGRKDTYEYAFKILKKYNLNATLHVVTGYVDNSWIQKGMSSSSGACSIENLKEMKQYGIEISSHGDTHITEKDDFNISIQKLKKWNLIDDCCGFSVPNSKEFELDNPSFMQNLLNKNISYVRVGKNLKKLTFLQKVYYVLYRITKINCFYLLYNRININNLENYDKMRVVSIPVRKDDNVSSLIRIVEKNINTNNWIIFMLHSILPENNSYYSHDEWVWNVNNFEELCKFLSKLKIKNLIDVKTIIDVVRSD